MEGILSGVLCGIVGTLCVVTYVQNKQIVELNKRLDIQSAHLQLLTQEVFINNEENEEPTMRTRQWLISKPF